MKKPKSTKKTIHSNKSSGKLFQTARITTDNNYLAKKIFAEDLQTEEFHKIFRKIDIADRIVTRINIAILTQDQNQREKITQIIIEIVPIQTL